MTTITLPRPRYEILKRRAQLYQAVLRTLPELRWGIEEYTPERIKEFMRQDKLDKKTLARVKELLVSLG